MTEQLGLFPYPPVGKVAVTKGGPRIAIWPDEGDDLRCFTGQCFDYRDLTSARVHGVSTMWLRSAIERVEAPTESDLALSLINLEF